MKLCQSRVYFGVLVLVATVLLSSCGGKDMSIEEFKQMAREAEERSATIASLQEEIRDIVQAYNQTVGPQRRLALQLDPDYGMNAREVSRLEHHIETEDDKSCCDLLRDVLLLQERIDAEHRRLHEITAKLPEPHHVSSGENHYKLCMNYLTEQHGLSHRTADSLVARVALNGDIVEGFHVWYYYRDGVFGTFVAQGDADISPTVFAKVVKRQLLKEARREGRNVDFEQILDSLRVSGALLANFGKGAGGL